MHGRSEFSPPAGGLFGRLCKTRRAESARTHGWVSLLAYSALLSSFDCATYVRRADRNSKYQSSDHQLILGHSLGRARREGSGDRTATMLGSEYTREQANLLILDDRDSERRTEWVPRSESPSMTTSSPANIHK